MLYWTMLAAALFGISMIPCYGLYAGRKDRPIVFSHLSSLPIFCIATLTLKPVVGIAAVLAAMCSAFPFLLIKLLAFKRCGPLAAPI